VSETRIPFTFTESVEGATHQPIPEKAHEDDAAYDLTAAEEVYLDPGDRLTVDTGVRIALPEGHAGLVLPRSGLASVHGITILNSPGLIDPGYRGAVGVTLWNTGSNLAGGGRWGAGRREPYHVSIGDRIAQLLIVKLPEARLAFWPAAFDRTLGNTERGVGGFGSTGR
jgi:dUTP pyrophosphatase